MTILAGFRCSDGIVICADTQETVNKLSKRSVPKLKVFAPPHYDGFGEALDSDLAAAFCGAGEGPMIDKLTTLIWQSIKHSTNLNEACQLAEETLKTAYAEYGRIFQPGFCPEIALIYGICMQGWSKLFTATGSIVNEVDGFASEGCGYYLADFLATKMYGPHLTTRQCVILAAYILSQAKEHVDGCGGESHIAVLRDQESSGQVDWSLIKHVTEMLDSVDKDFGSLLLQSSDLRATDSELDEARGRLNSIVGSLREYHAEELKNSKDFFDSLFGSIGRENDDLGLPKVKLTEE